MKLPKGAFPLPSGGLVPVALVVEADADKVTLREWRGLVGGGWEPFAGARRVALTPSQARKLCRRLAVAADRASAWKHAAGVVRRHS